MTPERWARLTEIFDAAIERPPAERPAFLVAACPEPSLRRDVERLLDSHERAEETDFGNSAAFQVTADVALEVGAHLGRYEVIALLGRGGMGNVYRARDPLLDREVAIKVLRHRGDVTPDDLQRFERETRAAGALHHPNVLAVYDVGTADGAPFVVSELLEGETLRARLARGPLPVTEAADVARQIIRGVAAAHDRGIIHRDLKPENLFLTREGVVRILDFGLAKQVVDDLDPDSNPAEGGLLMGVPIVLTLVLFADGIRRRFSSGQDDPATSWIRFGAVTAVAAIALQSVVEFSLQMPGNAVAFVVVAAIALHRPSSGQDSATAVRPVAPASLV